MAKSLRSLFFLQQKAMCMRKVRFFQWRKRNFRLKTLIFKEEGHTTALPPGMWKFAALHYGL